MVKIRVKGTDYILRFDMSVSEYIEQKFGDLRNAMNDLRQPGKSRELMTEIFLSMANAAEDYLKGMISWTGKESYFSVRYASLILAGHYNGGQWRIPWVWPVYVPELGWFPKDSEVQGLTYLGDVPQYISPGLGSDPHYEHQPGRVYNPPVITKIILTRKPQ